METYDEQSITILADIEANERFPYKTFNDLIVRYPHKPPEFIARLVQSCNAANYPLDLAVKRYLDGDKSVEASEELQQAHMDLLKKKRDRGWEEGARQERRRNPRAKTC